MLEAAREAGRKNSLSQIVFLPIIYGRRVMEYLLKPLIWDDTSLGADESEEPTSPVDNDALTIHKNI